MGKNMIDEKAMWEKCALENPHYYVKTTHRNHDEDEFKRVGCRDTIDLIINDRLIDTRRTILEHGCGIGRMTEFISLFFNHVFAVDISGEMIRKAQERLPEFSNITWMETDGISIPLTDGVIDIIFSFLVFQHMKTKTMVESNFREISRVLKSDGLFKVRLGTDKNQLKNQWWSGVAYDEREINDLCSKTGFEIIRKRQIRHFAMWLWLTKNI